MIGITISSDQIRGSAEKCSLIGGFDFHPLPVMAVGGSMSWFVVRFMKDVLGENGRECEVCQSVMEVDAANENAATEIAKETFCRIQHLNDWSLHADRINVRAADFPS